ncbi:[protein-PII] uridylyltransferase [Brevundimonas vitis]|uniref:Bifunctional uridylyltransferase/uridylyl-removing enzyme n=1 Tax=Brevundimonas vitisensis TaxID=2800818 RepID=A0ABX7BJK1_9CAUL|nr:[protein-PII] uridylyltransferase [Brevundimonas vitisensis]QQQ17391.1 [protein-PII] uridylyltransferase [Brevundimonas vitisensis]
MTDLPPLDDRLAHAALASDVRVAVSEVLRETYEAARARVARKLEAGLGGVEVARLYCAAADDLLSSLWRLATETLYPAPNPTEGEKLALVAVGGYGRGVLAPFSDLDILFLRPWKSSGRSEQVTEFMLYVLWDLGLKVGAASRSIDDCLKLGRDDMTVRTALLEARFLVGDEDLAEGMMTRFREQVSKADPRPFIAAKLEERNQRQIKAGAVRYKVEPNVKDGKGGLRDLNTLFWIARSLDPASPLGASVLEALLTARERRSFEEAFDFLWRVRAHLHLTAGRAEEKLTFDLQPEVARRMGWRGRGDEPAVERFMRRYFLVARDVGALTRAMSAQLEARQQKHTLSLSRLMPNRRRRLNVEGFVVEEGRLSTTGPDVFAQDPTRLLTLFVLADRHDLDLHPEAFSAVSRSLSLVTPALRRNPVAAQAFLDVLARGQRPYRVLTLMNETGLLGRFLPEWGRIVGQTQFNMYHAYTVDEHTLQAVGIINDIMRGKLQEDHPLATEIVHRIADPEVLMLAMLLHDVGKGGNRGQLEDGAISARRACERLGIDSRRIELVVWLVRHHLALSDYAQKRDVTDPDTISAFAALVGDPERLRMLLVLTAADIRAVGPGVWNSWKGSLMRDLYGRVDALFRGEALAGPGPLEAAPDLMDRARRTGAAAQALKPDGPETQAATRIVVAASDRPGLFADLATVLAAEGADVVGARVATAPDGMALDLFEVQDGAGLPYGQAEPRRLSRLVQALENAALGRDAPAVPVDRPISARRAAFEVRPVVMIDTGASEGATVIEVSGADRPGLLADLARTLATHGISVRSAHVASFGARAVDAFYVTDDGGSPLVESVASTVALRAALESVLDQAPVLPAGRRIVPVRASTRDVSELSASSVRRKPTPLVRQGSPD